MAEIGDVEFFVAIEHFAVAQREAGAFAGRYDEFAIAGNVLPEIEDRRAIG
ncbi:hypothetical protein D3C87_2167840 [compost metagenome]